jgi:ABC-type transport system involved in multi-copper enzyme maturation permease subunit
MRLVRGELRKLLKRPASRVTLIIQLALIVLIYFAVGASYKTLADAGAAAPNAEQSRQGIRLLLTFPGAYAGVIAFITGLGGLLAIAYGASAAGADWGWGMVKVAVARGESRSRYVLSKLLAVLLMIALGFLITYAVGVLAAIVAALIAGIGVSGLSDASVVGRLPEQMLRGWWGIAEEATMGFAIATVARSQLAGLGAGIALYFVEQFSTIFLPDVVRYLPFHVASSALQVTTGTGGGPGGGGGGNPLDPNASIVLVTIYLVIAAIASAVIVERAEITG